MTKNVTDKDYLTNNLYDKHEKLNIRILTHEDYTQPETDFKNWVLDLVTWQGNETVVDLGCGSGFYINAVMDRLKAEGRLICTDLAFGMLKEVKETVEQHDWLLNASAINIPFPDNSVDITLANHMLYHLPDIPAGLQEIHRVLVPGGHLIAATNGSDSMKRFSDEMERAAEHLGFPIEFSPHFARRNFSLENGHDILAEWFPEVILHTFESALVFPETKPVLRYLNSLQEFFAPSLPEEISWEALMSQVEIQVDEVIKQEGEYRVPKLTGAFVAQKESADQVDFDFHSGFVSVMGRPNVGKSTLINHLLGQKVAAVSHKPQTTRHQQLGILTGDDYQIVFIDTPGLHDPHHKLGELMNEEAQNALEDTDAILFLVDANEPLPDPEDRILVSLLESLDDVPPVLLALNKIDRVDEEDVSARIHTYQELLPYADVLTISATHSFHLDELIGLIIDRLPQGPPYYPHGQVTDLYEREIAADLIRAAALELLREEVPHSIAIRIDEYTERDDSGAYIAATIFVERDSHKGIVIGKGGQMIKKIGSLARTEIESMSGRSVFLKLRVKVRKNWRNDPNELRRFGFSS